SGIFLARLKPTPSNWINWKSKKHIKTSKLDDSSKSHKKNQGSLNQQQKISLLSEVPILNKSDLFLNQPLEYNPQIIFNSSFILH
ncbi:MAG: hypothetical protein MUF37_00550, partial [Methanoregulaceae archaeon]|nr:hypothetical protein [Methanoregulaceae archaeon]